MFAVIFEVLPRSDQWDAYLGNAKMLRPELELIEGFVDNIRYQSLQRDGWILSLSSWRDEKALVRWRTKVQHHEVQERGRGEILSDYHLRVGQIVGDTKIPDGYALVEQRLDETEIGEGTAITLITARRPAEFATTSNSTDCAQYLGLNYFEGDALVAWDVFEAVLTPGDLILMLVWRDKAAIEQFENIEESMLPPDTHRARHVRVVRDYGKFDRREAPQFYPPVKDDRGDKHE